MLTIMDFMKYFLFMPLFLLFIPIIAYAETGNVELTVIDPSGDPINTWGLEVRVYQNNNDSPMLEFEKPSNPQVLTLEKDKTYTINVYRHNMFAGNFFLTVNKPLEKIKIPVPDLGGMRFDVLYDDNKPVKGAKIEIFSQLGVKWAEGETNDEGRTERFWLQSPVKIDEQYSAKISIGENVSYEIPILRPSPGYNDQVVITPWKSVVDDQIKIKLFKSLGQPVSNYDGKFVVELYDVDNQRITESKVSAKGETTFSNIPVGYYFLRVLKLPDSTSSEPQTWAIKKVFIEKYIGEIKISGLEDQQVISNLDLLKSNDIVAPDETCNCVAFRLDNVQDYYLTGIQQSLINLFVEKNTPLTVGIIGKNLGSDLNNINFLKKTTTEHADIIKIGNHVGTNDITSLTKSEQLDLIKSTDDNIENLLGKRPTVFIPTFGTYNADTTSALEKEKIKYISSVSSFDLPPYPFHDVSMFRFPSTAATGYIEQGRAWYGISTNQTMNDIKYSIRDYGYAVVLLHPHEYSQRNGWAFQDQLDIHQYYDLNALIDLVRANGLKVVPIEQIDAEAQMFSTFEIPNWLKTTIIWWTDDRVPDSDFLNTVEYLIHHKIIKVPKVEYDSSNYKNPTIPAWLKNNSKLWAQGKISDREFLSGVEFLIKQGIIRVY